MEVVAFSDGAAFLACCEPFLSQRESENNLPIGLAASMAAGTRGLDGPLFLAVVDGDDVLGAAVRSHVDRGLCISPMPEAVAATLARSVAVPLAGCVGEASAVEAFACAYAERGGVRVEVAFRQGVYELSAVIMPSHEGFRLRQADESQRSIAETFIRGFLEDVFAEGAAERGTASESADRHLQNKTLFFLEDADGEPVAVAANVRQTRSTATIGLVYTPPSLRRRGYGALVTALLSQQLLDGGKARCNLFTDLANPTSNSVYQGIGYQRIGEARQVTFVTEEASAPRSP